LDWLQCSALFTAMEEEYGQKGRLKKVPHFTSRSTENKKEGKIWKKR